ncbi:aquaporin-like protein [Leucosporidium creatinivorum]|uniref:Aquaporin-like protein n=1 Tax=Leucosporidium creatinivorum TaxID=106004 RepID=A0A1Y2DHF7_9BASI|nr:aquaporin-like protein [Leucosporidium creatinivorum]
MSRPRATSRLESTTARLPSIRTNTLDDGLIERSPPPNVGGPQLAGTLLARRGQLPSQRSYRSSSFTGGGGSISAGGERERSPVWGVGGVFPRVSQKRRPPKARDFEEERAQQQARAPRYTSETLETFGTPQLEQPDPLAALGGSMVERQPTRRPRQPTNSLRTNSGVPAPSIHSYATTALDESSPKEEVDEGDVRSHVGTLDRGGGGGGTASIAETHDEEQGQVGGPLNEDNEQWEEDFEGDQWEPPVRNNWGRLRYALREPFAEFLGMLVLIVLGVGADCQVKISQTTAGDSSSVNWTWGFGVMSGIYIAGGISGGHLNPALTIALACFRGFPWRMVPRYILAQILGAFCGAFIIYGNYKKALDEYDPNKLIYNALAENGSVTGNASASLFVTVPNISVGGTVQGFCQEILATAVLAVIVLALGDENNAPPGAGLGALVLGFVVTAIGMSMGWISGYAINVARDFGPRLALWCIGYGTKLWTHDACWWLVGPICGTILGALAGCFIYDLMVFTGGGSPLNTSAHEIRYALHLPKIHSMVRSAINHDTVFSPEQEAQLEGGRSFREDFNRRAGQAPKKEAGFGQRWEAGRAKVKREDQELKERQQERIRAIIEEREREVSGVSAE